MSKRGFAAPKVCAAWSARAAGTREDPGSWRRRGRTRTTAGLWAGLVTAATLTFVPVAAGAVGAAPPPGKAGDTSVWNTFHGNPQLTGVSTDTTISASNAVHLGLQWMTQTGAPAESSPVTDYDATLGETLAFIGNTDGDFEAVNAANGSIVWSDYFGVPIYASPTIYGGDVWVGTFVGGRMYKLNETTGAVDCSISLGTGTDLSSPTIATPPGGKPTVYFGVQDNGVVSSPVTAIDEASCKQDWATIPYNTPASGSWNPTSFGVDATGEPLVLSGSGNPDSSAYALDANTGARVWFNQNLHPAESDVGAGITVSPPGDNGYADGVAYYPGLDGYLYAIDLTTGKTLWTFDFAAATTPSQYKGGRSAAALVGQTLVFGTGTGVMAVNAVTGAEIWDSAKTIGPDTEIISSPLVTGPAGNQVVVFGDMNGAVKVLSLATGAPLFSFQTGGYIIASPAESAGNILVDSSDGFIYSFGLGGTTSTDYPSTAISSPANGATLTNPNTATSTSAPITVSGTASAHDPSAAVLVEIEEDGPDGPWWNATTGSWQQGPTWNQATVTATSPTTGTWTLPAPIGRAGGVWLVSARTRDSDGEVDPQGASSTITITPVSKGPRLKTNVAWVSPNARVEVSGAGFHAGESVQISLPGSVLATTTASAKGVLRATSILVPTRFPYGEYAFTATGETSGLSATAPIYVTSPWTGLGNGPARTGYLPQDNVFNSEEVPSQIYRMKAGVVYDTGAAIRSSAAVANGIAYVGNDAGDVDAVRAATGSLVWQETTGGPVDSSPALDLKAGLVLVGSGDENVYALNLETGATVWKAATGGAVESSPTILNGVVYVGSDDGHLYAINESDGAILWSAPLTGEVISSPAVDSSKGLVVVGDTNGDVSAFGATGTLVWTYKTGGAVSDAPIISGGNVYVGSDDGHEYALSEASGAVVWSTAIGGDPGETATVNGSNLFVGSSSDYLYSLAASTGAVQWKFKATSAITGVSSSVGIVFVESANGIAYGFRTSGKYVWIAQTGAGLAGTPALSDNAVVIGGEDSGVYVYSPYGLPMV